MIDAQKKSANRDKRRNISRDSEAAEARLSSQERTGAHSAHPDPREGAAPERGVPQQPSQAISLGEKARARSSEAALSPSAVLLTIKAFCAQYAVGRTQAYRLLKEDRIEGVKINAGTRITRASAEAWRAQLPRYKSGKPT